MKFECFMAVKIHIAYVGPVLARPCPSKDLNSKGFSSKRLSIPITMTNSSSSKKKSKNKVHATTSKDPKTHQKRGRKVALPIVRPTLPNYHILLKMYLLFVCSDCGIYVDAFAEYLRDEISIPSISFWSDYLRNRYATLL
ncbi:hypothetical protein H5410_052485 [Solanum commersonii]|uniref:Uncharacterized protein n=1 Tax=Solanum commersonii TaxID=4109 RepID=A0A9J5X1L6_SOLCO|nr:hypothetical protein H5410_052485 [Solanum commersonii]